MKAWVLGVVLVGCGSGAPAVAEAPPPTETTTTAAPAPPATTAPTAAEPMAHDRLPDAARASTMELPEATAGPVLMRSATLAEGETMELPPSDDQEHLVLVLSGEIQLAPGSAMGAYVRAWHAARARGVPVVLTGVKPTRLVTAIVHGEPLADRDVEVLNLGEREELTWAGGRAHARLAFEDGRASFGLLYAHHDVGVPRHRHERSTEIVGLLSGQGTMGIGDEDRTVSAGDVFHMPAGVEHDYRPDGSETLFAVQLYVPPGPEQRFKDLAREEATP